MNNPEDSVIADEDVCGEYGMYSSDMSSQGLVDPAETYENGAGI